VKGVRRTGRNRVLRWLPAVALLAIGCDQLARIGREAGTGEGGATVPRVVGSAAARSAAATPGVGGGGAAIDPGGASAVLRGREGRPVPFHPAPGDNAVSARVPDGAEVVVLGEDEATGWRRIRAPDGTEGWVSRRYVDEAVLGRPSRPVVSSSPVPETSARGSPVPPGLPDGFPLPDDTCPAAVPDPSWRLRETAVESVASVPGPPEGTPTLDRLVVVSYNLWELYDGRDGDRYLAARGHPEADALDEAHAARRIAVLADQIDEVEAEVLVFQEVEDAETACAVAAAAQPGRGWRCWASTWANEPHPQNVAVASRVPAAVVSLDPARGMGQRGVLELSVEGTALRIAAVHLKSSVGAAGKEDCGNAAKRMAVAYGLWRRREANPGAAWLIVGDFNHDPRDERRQTYDRTDDILALDGARDLILEFLPQVRGAVRSGEVVDRAWFLGAGGWTAGEARFLDAAALRGWASDHRPLVVVVERRR
jgi:hypothetical protein